MKNINYESQSFSKQFDTKHFEKWSVNKLSVTFLLYYLCLAAILDAILDFILLECSKKNSNYFFQKLMISS